MGDRLTKAVSAIRSAQKRLQPEQGERARRNAREAMLTALRAARAALDEEYPITIKRKAPSSAPQAKTRRANAFTRMHAEVSASTAALFQETGIPVIRRNKAGARAEYTPRPAWWVPLWVKQMMDLGAPHKLIAEYTKDWRRRRRYLALKQLGQHGN